MKYSILSKERLTADNQDVPLYQKVQDLILEEIKSGTLKPGTLIPSTRELAELLGVSRKTTVKAIENLIMKGHLESRDRVGTYVRKKLPEKGDGVSGMPFGEKKNTEGHSYMLVINDGFPDTRLVPFREFSRAHRQIFNRMAQWMMLCYNPPVGYGRLRSIVAEILGRLAGLSVDDDDVCVVRGSQMALFLVANAILSPGDHIAMETPGYDKAYKAFHQAGLNIHGIPVDDEGIDVDRLEALCKEIEIHAIYITPRYQYPTTATLSMARRQKLRDLSLRYRFLVIEDDFGLAYNFNDRHVPPMSVMLPKSHYIYIGTFSKVFAPGIRLGYLASSADIVRQIASYRTLVDIQGDIITERAICELFDSGHLQKHIRHSLKAYKERLGEASAAIRDILGDSVTYRQPRGGLALWLSLKGESITEEALRKYLHAHDIDAPIFTLATGRVGIRIGYASLLPSHLKQFLERLKVFIVQSQE